MFAEQEKQHKVEAEMKRLELERKQWELVRRREVEEEELKVIITLESLKTEADNKLAEARKMAAITEHMELGLSDNETTSMELMPLSHALPSPSIKPPLTTVTPPTLSSTPKLNVSLAHTPGVCASSSVTSLGLEPPVMSSVSPQTPP